MECIGLKYFNVFGRRQDPNGAYTAVIPKFISMLKNGKRQIINCNCDYSHDFTYIDNIVLANKLGLFTENEKLYTANFNFIIQ